MAAEGENGTNNFEKFLTERENSPAIHGGVGVGGNKKSRPGRKKVTVIPAETGAAGHPRTQL